MRGNVVSINQGRADLHPNGGLHSFNIEKFVDTSAFQQMIQSECPVLILAAPAGYGKSRLLRAFAQHCSGQRLSCAWRGPESGTIDRSFTNVDTVFLDDMHQASTDRLLQIVNSASSSNFRQRICIATRMLPEANWLSLEAKGVVEIFRPEQLKMSLAETREMLTQYAGSQPSPNQIEQVWVRTEGWPIAAQWYGMLAKQRGGWSRLSIGGSQSRDDLSSYLNEMIYAELDESMRNFLYDVGDLEVFRIEMLEDIMSSGELNLLHRLHHESMLIQTASDEVGHLKLQGLLQTFVENKRRLAGRARNISLLDRAYQWCLGHQLYPEAIEYALRANRLGAAHELLASHCEEIVNVRGELPGMLRWTDVLKHAGIDLLPSLALWRIWALILAGELEKADTELECIRAIFSSDMSDMLHLHAARLELSLATRRKSPEEIIVLADAWLAEWGGQDPFHSAATYVMRAMANHAQGQLMAAQRDIAAARCSALACNGLYAQMWVVKAEAYISMRSGRVVAARDLLLSAIDKVRGHGTVSASTLGTLHLLISRVFVELRDFERAGEHLAAGHMHFGDTGLIEMDLAAKEAAAFLAEEESVESASRELQADKARNIRSCVERDLSTVRLLLRSGRKDEAISLFEAAFTVYADTWQHLGQGVSIPASLLPALRLVNGQLLYAMGRVDEAENICRELLIYADTRGFTDDYLGLLFLAAACAHQDGRRSEARRFLIRAVRIAAERSAMHGAVSVSWPVEKIMSEYSDLDEGLRVEASLLLAIIRKRYGVEQNVESGDVLLESLTARELEVLSMLDSGLTNDSIAVRLNMGLSTVKWHIRNIYAKLDVRNRSGALVRSRRLGLIRDLAI